jgi:uncharacterized protein YjcR
MLISRLRGKGNNTMSDLYKLIRQCYRKKKYLTERKARGAVDKAQREYGEQMTYYDCSNCRYYHLTKSGIDNGKVL